MQLINDVCCGVKSSISLLPYWYLYWIWTTQMEPDLLQKVLLVAHLSAWQLQCYDARSAPSWGRAASEQHTVQSHKNNVNPLFLVSLLGTVICDDLTGHGETSALLLLNCMCLGVTEFSVFLPPNNCLLCHSKRLLTLSLLHPIIYSCWWLFLPFCSHTCRSKVTSKSVEISSKFWG